MYIQKPLEETKTENRQAVSPVCHNLWKEPSTLWWK